MQTVVNKANTKT